MIMGINNHKVLHPSEIPVLYSKRIYSASEIWRSFSSSHEKCSKTNKLAFKRDRLKAVTLQRIAPTYADV